MIIQIPIQLQTVKRAVKSIRKGPNLKWGLREGISEVIFKLRP